MSSLPTFLQEALSNIEPGATFSGTLPAITSSSGRRYFAKHGTPQEVEQWMGEAESLKAMKLAAPGLAPEVLEYGVVDRNGNAATAGDADARPYFVSQYLDLGRLTNKSAEELGRRLATGMHQYTSERGFGFDIPTYCGVTRLKNGWFPSWEACYNSMIADLVSQLRKKGRNAELCRRTEEVQEKIIPALLGHLDVKPVLLHGDLWSGNTGTNQKTGEPVIFDPSSFYGHNEADLAIGRMFGGIPASFYETYHTHLPETEPSDQYELRQELYELFHYLNHTLIFGSGYAGSSMRKIDTLLGAHKAGRL